ncbi:MAG TPA: hypothetical protein VHG08_25080 [Longimicrobium sp.]|nr:hypothetical protein [Longimicrobium sp.]
MTEAPREPHPQAAPPVRHGPVGYLVAAWLAATAARFAWAAYTARVPLWSQVAAAVVALVAAAAVVPFLRFRRSGWEMAMWVLVAALVMDVVRIGMGEARWLPPAAAAGATAFCLGYAWRARAAFRDPDEGEEAPPEAPSAAAPAERGPSAAEDALAAIHRRIVEAGSACAVPREALLAEAARYGAGEDALRTEGISLYRTFLDHFRRRGGALTPEQERELACLQRVLDLDPDAVDRLRAGDDGPAIAPEPAPPESVEHTDSVEHVAPAEEPVAVDMTVRAEPDVRPAESAGPAHAGPARVGPEEMTYTLGIAGRAAAELADYEQHELGALLSWAGISLPPSAGPRAALERLRALHRISTEALEEVPAGHPLEPGERCFAVRTVELYRVSPGAQPSEAPPAPRPVDPRAFVDGSLEEDCDLSPFGRAGACRFLVTDRRLLLVAPSGQQSPLPLDRIRSVHPHRNGLQVRPLRGNPVFLAFHDGVDDVAMRISRVMNDARAS